MALAARLRILSLISLVALILGVLTSAVSEGFNLKALDLQFRWHLDAQRRDERIVIVAVDQPSLDYFEQDNI